MNSVPEPTPKKRERTVQQQFTFWQKLKLLWLYRMYIPLYTKRQTATLEKVVAITPTVKEFTFRFPKPVSYRPGDVVLFYHNHKDKENRVHKYYTISSVSEITDPHRMEFIIKLVPDGEYTPYLFAQQPGFTELICGPVIGLDARNMTGSRIVMLAAGTAIAGPRAVVKALHAQGDTRPITLIAGSRYETEILYHQELTELEQSWDNFTYIPVVSRPSDDWIAQGGKTGYVQHHLPSSPVEYADTTFLASGLRVMLDEIREMLYAADVDKRHIRLEYFEAYEIHI